MSITNGIEDRIFYGEDAKDMRDMQIFKELGYTFTEVAVISKQFPMYFATGYEEKL